MGASPACSRGGAFLHIDGYIDEYPYLGSPSGAGGQPAI
jgi:hypothetical protein